MTGEYNNKNKSGNNSPILTEEMKLKVQHIEKLAEWLHNEYERVARRVNWKTQKSCQVKFKDLPKNNKKVMMLMARKVQRKLEEYNENGLRGCKCERVYLDEGY